MRCALCQLPLTPEQAVCDHSHSSGAIRGTLHRGCNSLLGKLENNYKRYGVDLKAFTKGVSKYVTFHQVNRTGLIHPTFHTVEEKIIRRKARAKKTRQSKKKSP